MISYGLITKQEQERFIAQRQAWETQSKLELCSELEKVKENLRFHKTFITNCVGLCKSDIRRIEDNVKFISQLYLKVTTL